MSFEYLTHYDRLCLTTSVEEIRAAYPHISPVQIEQEVKLMKAMETEWEKAKFRRFLRKIRAFIYGR